MENLHPSLQTRLDLPLVREQFPSLQQIIPELSMAFLTSINKSINNSIAK
jgi:hypothetical protein